MEKTRFLQKIVKNQNLPVDIWGRFQFQVERSKKACAKFQFDTTISYACYFSAKKLKFGIKIGGIPLEVYPGIIFLLVFLQFLAYFCNYTSKNNYQRSPRGGNCKRHQKY